MNKPTMLLYAQDILITKYAEVVVLARGQCGKAVRVKVYGVQPFRCYVVGAGVEVVGEVLRGEDIEYTSLHSDSKYIVERCTGDPGVKQCVTTIIFKNGFQRYKADSFAKRRSCPLKFYDTRFDAAINALTIMQDNLRVGFWFECDSVNCQYTDIRLRIDHRDAPPLLLHSFDVETTGLNKQAGDARVIMVGACEGMVNGPIDREIVWIGRQQRDDKPSWFNERFPNAELRWFENESEMLNDWRLTMRKCSVLTGYNSHAFDMPYVFERTTPAQRVFGNTDSPSQLRTKVQSSKQKGTIEYEFVSTEGILHIDMMHVAMQQLKLPTYSLNSVAHKVLKEAKEDVKPSEIVPFFNSADSEKFWKLVAYQVLDARLPYRLLQALNSYNYVAGFTRIVPIPPAYILERGQMIRVFSYIRSIMKDQFPDHFIGERTETRAQVEFSYEGGCVLEPVKGVYTEFITILDFMSLYPSIASGNNFSFETVLTDRFAADKAIKAGHEVAIYDIGDGDSAYFIQDVPGILPNVIERLLAERREAKTSMKGCQPGTLDYEYYNTTQLSVKVLANSIYGFCGTPFAPVFEPYIARAITAVGRNMIEATRDRLEDCEPQTKVIYGDTDSVMPKGTQFGGDYDRMSAYAKWLALAYTNMHTKPHVLEDEGITEGNGRVGAIFTDRKKTYTYINRKEGMSVTRKGLETDKREYPPVVSEICTALWDTILLSDGDRQPVFDLAKVSIDRFMRGDYPKEKWAISVKYNRTEFGTPPHVLLAQRAAAETPDIAPKLGDRFQYVVCKSIKVGAELHECMFLLQDVLQRADLVPDPDYYWESKLKNAVERFFDALGMPQAIVDLRPTFQKCIN